MTTPSNKRWVVVIVALVAAGVLALWKRDGLRSAGAPLAKQAVGAATTSAKSPAVTPVLAAVTARHTCKFDAGQTLSYAVDISGSSTLPSGMLGQDPKAPPIPLTTSTKLSLDLRALAATASGSTVLLAHYRDLTSTLVGDPKTLAAPFLLRVADTCEITGFARRSGTTKAYARTQQSLVHELMWTSPAQNGAEVRSEDGYGPYLARYTVQDQSVTREVLSYDAFWDEEHGGPQRLDVVPKVSRLDVALDTGAWFESASGHARLAGSNISFETRLTAKRGAAPDNAFEGLPTDASAYEWEDLLPQVFKLRAPRVVTAMDLQARAEVVHYTARQSVDRFMKRVTDKVAFHRTWPELTNYLEARPDQTTAVVDELKHGSITQEAAPAFYVALGRTRTPEALSALHDIFQSEAAPLPERIRAAFAMIDRDDVDVGLAREMAQHADHIDDKDSKVHRLFGREVALAMGALSGLHPDDQDMKQVVMDTAKSILAKSKDPILVRPAYGALANMGDLAALPLAEQAFASADPKMREVAAIVIRRMSPRDTNDVVVRWLQAETDPNVKRAIYSVVSRQMADIKLPASPALINRAVLDLQSDPGAITRKAIIRVLGRSVSASPEARAALMAQVPLELKKKRSSMYSLIVSFLSPEDSREALHHAL